MEDILADIRVLKKYAHSRLPVCDRRRAAVFDAPVPRNASNVFEETTFNGTVEMTRVGTSRDFVRYGAAVFDAPVPRNASNVFEQTTFSGTVEMTRVSIRVYGERIIRVSIARDLHVTGSRRNYRCQVRYTCSPQRDCRNGFNGINNPINGIF